MAKNKSYLPLVLLVLIVLFGFHLRIYHFDYPVVGYHNWKEVHYLTEARNFARNGFFKYGFFIPAHDYPHPIHDPSGAHADTFPTISILGAVFFKIFGIKLWVARMVGILFNSATIVVMYFFVRKLFHREDLALVSSFIAAILPLLVFFSHNVQLINPGIFFAVTSAYFYLRWRESFKGSDLILTSLFLVLATLTKYPFLLVGVPMLLTLPYKKIFKERKFLSYLVSFLIFLSIPVWYFYSSQVVSAKTKTMEAGLHTVSWDKILKQDFWDAMINYAKDNYTMLGVFFAFLGLLFLVFSFKKERKFSETFLLFYLLSLIPFLVVMAGKLSGHSYHQYPFAPLVIILIAYFIVSIADFFKKLKVEDKGIPHINLICILLLSGLLFFPFQEAYNRQFDTQFYGLDVAGEYIKEHKVSGERVMHSSHQAYGVLWHGDIKGTRGIPKTVEDMKFAEENLNATWIFMYNWDFGKIMGNEELWSYIQSNYELKQFAFIQTSEGNQPVYMLFKKGGAFDEKNLNNMLMGKPVMDKDYELTRGKTRLNYINL